MSNSGCPTHRKGAMKAALAQRDTVDGELEPSEERNRSARVVASGPRELVTKLAEKAMRVLEDDLELGEARERTQAAQVLVAAWMKIDEGEKEKPQLTPDERRAALVESLRNPDPELRAALEEVGLVKQ